MHKDIISSNKKEFNTNVRETRTMTQEQVLKVLGRMRVHSLTVAFKQWIADHFYDDFVHVTEEGEEKEIEKEEKVEENEEQNSSIVECSNNRNDQNMTVNELTETLKHEFLNKYDFFTYNNDVWTMAKPIAEFLEFEKKIMCYLSYQCKR